jgi:hypothetical protein
VAALAGLGVYFATAGLDKADKLASVIGVFIAVAGLGVAVYGLIAERRSSGGGIWQRSTAAGRGRVNQAGRDINEKPPGQPVVSKDATAARAIAGDEAHSVRQWAKAAGGGQVHQAGRDINKR